MRSAAKKIHSADSLRRVLARAARGKNVVFTNGVFDILHRGHVSYLERARKLGDLLVVAINSDASVKRLKGPARPINPLADRMFVMAGLECVDYVTSFGEDTPLETIRKLKPKVLVKGGDYRISTIVGAPDVIGWGGKVKTLSFVEGRSTTKIIEKSRRRR